MKNLKFEPNYLKDVDGEFCRVTGKHRERWLIRWYEVPKSKPGYVVDLDKWTIYDDGEKREIEPDDWLEFEFAFHGSRTKAIAKAKSIKKERKKQLVVDTILLTPNRGLPIEGYIGVYEWAFDTDWDEIEIWKWIKAGR